MYADIRLDEVQNKLSAGCHFSEFKRSHERSQGFKQKKYIPPGCGILETHGGVFGGCERCCCGECNWGSGIQCSHGRGRYLAKSGGWGTAGSRHAGSSCHTPVYTHHVYTHGTLMTDVYTALSSRTALCTRQQLQVLTKLTLQLLCCHCLSLDLCLIDEQPD